jgi:hypothetical protein
MKYHAPSQLAFLISVCLFVILAILMQGCTPLAQWSRTNERTYGVSYDANTQTGALSMTIRPVTQSQPAPAAGMSDETIARIVKLLYDASAKQRSDSAAILETPALK